MARLSFHLTVRHPDHSPVTHAQARIVDRDVDGEDLLWEGDTGPDGVIQGTTGDWQDRVVTPEWVVEFTDSPGGPVPTNGHWEERIVPDASDSPSLSLRIEKDGRAASVPLVLVGSAFQDVMVDWDRDPPADSSPVSRHQRAMLVVSELVSAGEPRFAWLYEFLNSAGVVVARQIAGGAYARFASIEGSAVTMERIVQEVSDLAALPEIRAIDVVFNVHGLQGSVCLMGGRIDMAEVSARLRAVSRGKLRLMYDTSCYGVTHADEWLAAGFRAASGSKGVNANSLTEYPTVLALWVNGSRFGAAVSAGASPVTRIPLDLVATKAGFKGVNSEKQVFGDAELTISSPA